MLSSAVISKSKDPLKHYEISIPRHIRFAELRKIQIEQPNFTNKYVILLLKLKIYTENIVEKGSNCTLGAIFPLIHNILLPDVRIVCILTFMSGKELRNVYFQFPYSKRRERSTSYLNFPIPTENKKKILATSYSTLHIPWKKN